MTSSSSSSSEDWDKSVQEVVRDPEDLRNLINKRKESPAAKEETMETDEADDEEEVKMLETPASKFVGGYRKIQRKRGEPTKTEVKKSDSQVEDEDPFDADTSFLREDTDSVSETNLSDVMEQMNRSMEEYEENKNRATEKMMIPGNSERFPALSADVESLLAPPPSPEAAGQPEASLEQNLEPSTPSTPGSMPSLYWSTTTGDSGHSSEDNCATFLTKDAVIFNSEQISFINQNSCINHVVNRILAISKTCDPKAIQEPPLAPETMDVNMIAINDFNISPYIFIQYLVFILFNHHIPELMRAQLCPSCT